MRFIEYMDVGNANQWKSEKLVSKEKILATIQKHYSLNQLGRDQDTAPSVDYRFSDGGGDIGVIASVTEPFCGSCTRARLTADGKLVTCLFSNAGHDLKSVLRRGKTDDEIRAFVESVLDGAPGPLFRGTLGGVEFRSRVPGWRAQENRDD